jgi:hypothetical protein
MVHYGGDQKPPLLPVPLCPKCGSRQTEIVGRLEDGRTLIFRCNVCGAHSTIVSPTADAPSIDSLFTETVGVH